MFISAIVVNNLGYIDVDGFYQFKLWKNSVRRKDYK